MKGYFITGTDTGVGKTFVASLIARTAVAEGQRVFAFKPIETGCRMIDGSLLGDDGEDLAHAAGDWQRGELRGCYRFSRPAAPNVAREGTAIDFDRIIEIVRVGSARVDLVLVEGAGGWRAPITDATDMSSLAKALGFPVIVVARATLGTINHTLLTLEAIERSGTQLACVFLSLKPEDDRSAAQSNAREIAARTRIDIEIVDSPTWVPTLLGI